MEEVDEPTRSRWRRIAAIICLVILAGVLVWALFTFVISDPAVFLDYLRVLVWPAVICAIVLSLRKEIRDALARLTGGEVDALGMKLRLELSRARKEMKASEIEQHPRAEATQAIDEANKRAWEIVDEHLPAEMPESTSSPISRVTLAFIGFIMAVIQGAEVASITAPDVTGAVYSNVMTELLRKKVISHEELTAARRLERIYQSQVAPPLASDGDPTFDDLYWATARELAANIIRKTLTAATPE